MRIRPGFFSNKNIHDHALCEREAICKAHAMYEEEKKIIFSAEKKKISRRLHHEKSFFHKTNLFELSVERAAFRAAAHQHRHTQQSEKRERNGIKINFIAKFLMRMTTIKDKLLLHKL